MRIVAIALSVLVGGCGVGRTVQLYGGGQGPPAPDAGPDIVPDMGIIPDRVQPWDAGPVQQPDSQLPFIPDAGSGAPWFPDARPRYIPDAGDPWYRPDTGGHWFDVGPWHPGDADPWIPPDAGNTSCYLGATIPCTCGGDTFGAARCVGASYGQCVCPPQPPPPPRTEREQLAWLRDGIVGEWYGVFSNPWQPDARVAFAFLSDGTFEAACVAPEGCAALYYGHDRVRPRRSWRVVDVRADDNGEGELEFAFGSPPYQPGEWVDIALSEDLGHLHFRLWRVTGRGRYGPLVYRLSRVP